MAPLKHLSSSAVSNVTLMSSSWHLSSSKNMLLVPLLQLSLLLLLLPLLLRAPLSINYCWNLTHLMEDFPRLFLCLNINDYGAWRILESFQQTMVFLVQIRHDYNILLCALTLLLISHYYLPVLEVIYSYRKLSTLSSLPILSNSFGKNVKPILLQAALHEIQFFSIVLSNVLHLYECPS